MLLVRVTVVRTPVIMQELKMRGVSEQQVRSALQEVFGPSGRVEQRYAAEDEEGDEEEEDPAAGGQGRVLSSHTPS